MNTIRPYIMLGIPTWGKTTINWGEARNSLQFPLGCNVTTAVVQCSDVGSGKIDTMRNEIVRRSLASGATHTAFLGDDVVPPANLFLQLLSRQVDIVTGIYWTKGYPKEPYIWRGLQNGPYTQWKHGEFFEVDMAGCDALLVNNKVFRAMPEPWFSCNWTWEPDTIPGALTTEDFYFYVKAKAAGFKAWADTCAQCGHEDRETGVQFWLTDDQPQARKDVLKKNIKRTEKLCADIGAGHYSEHWDGKLYRYDMDESTKPDIRADARQIPEPPNRFDEVRSRHVLEHFTSWEAPELLREWLRILKVGGIIRVKVPNLDWAMRKILAHEEGERVSRDDLWYAWGVLYGTQEFKHAANLGMIHKNGYTARVLKNLFEQVGGTDKLQINVDKNDTELEAVAIKTKDHKPEVLINWWNEAQAKRQASKPRRRPK